MITEQEYVDMSDLTKARMALKIIYDIIPKNSKVIKAESHRVVVRILNGWEKDLGGEIHIDESSL